MLVFETSDGWTKMPRTISILPDMPGPTLVGGVAMIDHEHAASFVINSEGRTILSDNGDVYPVQLPGSAIRIAVFRMPVVDPDAGASAREVSWTHEEAAPGDCHPFVPVKERDFQLVGAGPAPDAEKESWWMVPVLRAAIGLGDTDADRALKELGVPLFSALAAELAPHAPPASDPAWTSAMRGGVRCARLHPNAQTRAFTAAQLAAHAANRTSDVPVAVAAAAAAERYRRAGMTRSHAPEVGDVVAANAVGANYTVSSLTDGGLATLMAEGGTLYPGVPTGPLWVTKYVRERERVHC
jgi:hypothetical protein